MLTGSETGRKIENAKTFMLNLERFANKIQNMTYASTVPAFAHWRAAKIRIAILDTGIDVKEDTLLETALEENRIRECCGFVNDPDSDPDPADYQDVNSHGTHVARLVLNAAPSAEILIGKISNDTAVGAQDLHRIARVGAITPREYEGSRVAD